MRVPRRWSCTSGALTAALLLGCEDGAAGRDAAAGAAGAGTAGLSAEGGASSGGTASGGTGGNAGHGDAGREGGTADAAGLSGAGGGGGSGGALDRERAAEAARATATGSAACRAIPNFYWEIGDARGAIVSGAVGTAFSASTVVGTASASKFIFGAYVVERFRGDLSRMDADALRMLSGYTSFTFSSCVGAATVERCFTAGNNGSLDVANVGRFYYGGGHHQRYALELGLGPLDNAGLTAAVKQVLGPELDFSYGSPQLAGGVRASAAGYAGFLRKLLSGALALRQHLGEAPVCTLPSACPTAAYSPASDAWHYSYGHWVEDDPVSGDGAFSSPGAFGFYPWIDASKTYYGVLSRSSLAADAYLSSARCGAELRKAFVSAQARP